MRTKNEFIIGAEEWGSIAINKDGEALELKPGVIRLDGIMLEDAISTSPNKKDYDPTASINIHLGYPITLPIIIFGTPQFANIAPITSEPVKELVFRKEIYMEMPNGDIVDGEYVKMHNGKPLFKNLLLDSDTNSEGSEKSNNNDKPIPVSPDGGDSLGKHNFETK